MTKITTAVLKREIKRLVQDNRNYFDEDGDPQTFKERLKPWSRVEKCRLPNSEWLDLLDAEAVLAEVLSGKKSVHFDLYEVGQFATENSGINLNNCWCRTFMDSSGEDFRVNIITDPKDENIIFMGFIGD